MGRVFHIVFQIAAFLLFQTVLLHLVGQSNYEKYIRTFSGFLLILLLFSALRSVLEGENLMFEIERQVEFATEEGDFQLKLRQAEESQQQQLWQGYEKRILEEAAQCLAEERYFLSEGNVTFSKEWKLERIELVVSKTWEDGKKEGEEDEEDMVDEIWIEPIEGISPIQEIGSSKKEKPQKEEGSMSVKGDSDQELAQLQDRLAKRLGIQQKQIILRWKGA